MCHRSRKAGLERESTRLSESEGSRLVCGYDGSGASFWNDESRTPRLPYFKQECMLFGPV